MSQTQVVNIKRTRNYEEYCGRGGDWGNPYRIGRDGNREDVIRKFRGTLSRMIEKDETIIPKLARLSGKRLGCYCAPAPCHAEVLAAAADLARQLIDRKENPETRLKLLQKEILQAD